MQDEKYDSASSYEDLNDSFDDHTDQSMDFKNYSIQKKHVKNNPS